MVRPTAGCAAERAALQAYLREQRAHVTGILQGLDDDALRGSVLPSGWTPLGLVGHLTIDVERFWFRAVIAAEPAAVEEISLAGKDDHPANAWIVGPEVSAADLIGRYQEEAERADAIIAATPLEASPAWWPGDLFGDWRLADVRAVLLHVIAETACHAGHLDIVRELADGRQWCVNTA